MRWILAFSIFVSGSAAYAQGMNWLNAEYTYTDFTYSEGDAKENARLPGIRGELGFVFGEGMGASAGGEYQDGMMDFSGANYTGSNGNLISKNYIRDTRLLLHYFMGNMAFAGGLAQREWYNNLVGLYHRRQTIQYYPLVFTMQMEKIYFKFEMDVSMKGKMGVSMSETGAGARDVDFHLPSGSGFLIEAGMSGATSGKFFYRLFASYRRLAIEPGGSQNDGVRTVFNNKGITDLISAGIGLSF